MIECKSCGTKVAESAKKCECGMNPKSDVNTKIK